MSASISKKPLYPRRRASKKTRNSNFIRKSADKNFLELDKATIAANIELKEQKRDLIYNLIALSLKCGLLTIFLGSFVRLGIASHQRIMRNMEISSVLNFESKRLHELNQRFDGLFTIGGRERLIGEQDHLIAPNSFRVIWK